MSIEVPTITLNGKSIAKNGNKLLWGSGLNSAAPTTLLLSSSSAATDLEISPASSPSCSRDNLNWHLFPPVAEQNPSTKLKMPSHSRTRSMGDNIRLDVFQEVKADTEVAPIRPNRLSNVGNPIAIEEDRVDSIESPYVRMRDVPCVPDVPLTPEGPEKEEESVIYMSMFDYMAQNNDELELRRGSLIRHVSKAGEPGWCRGVVDGRTGVLPANYVSCIGRVRHIRHEDVEIVEYEIGEGMTAKVHKGIFNKQLVAYKVGTPKVQEGKNFVWKNLLEEIIREAAFFRNLSHPNIVTLYGVVAQQPHYGLVLELCEGGNLRKVFNSVTEAALPKRIIVDWCMKIASAMHCIAKKKFVHRDLKMDNILVKEKVCLCKMPTSSMPDRPNADLYNHADFNLFGVCGKCGGTALDRLTLKLTDFGLTQKIKEDVMQIATEEDKAKLNSRAAGTSLWIAPEVYGKNEYSEKSDVWSFGVLMWHLVTRKEPYEGYDAVIVPFMIIRNNLRLPVSEKHMPKQFCELIRSCCHLLRPEERPNFEQIVEELEEYNRELLAVTGADEIVELSLLEKDIDCQMTEFMKHQSNNINIGTMEGLRRVKEIMLCSFVPSYSSPANAPAVKQRKMTLEKPQRRKVDKNLIGKPELSYHIGLKKVDGALHDLQLQCERVPSGSNASFADSAFGGTLPRQCGGHAPLRSALSISQPNLHQCAIAGTSSGATAGGQGGGTLKRVDAIRKKRNYTESGFSPITSAFSPVVRPRNLADNQRSQSVSSPAVFGHMTRAPAGIHWLNTDTWTGKRSGSSGTAEDTREGNSRPSGVQKSRGIVKPTQQTTSVKKTSHVVNRKSYVRTPMQPSFNKPSSPSTSSPWSPPTNTQFSSPTTSQGSPAINQLSISTSPTTPSSPATDENRLKPYQRLTTHRPVTLSSQQPLSPSNPYESGFSATSSPLGLDDIYPMFPPQGLPLESGEDIISPSSSIQLSPSGRISEQHRDTRGVSVTHLSDLSMVVPLDQPSPLENAARRSSDTRPDSTESEPYRRMVGPSKLPRIPKIPPSRQTVSSVTNDRYTSIGYKRLRPPAPPPHGNGDPPTIPPRPGSSTESPTAPLRSESSELTLSASRPGSSDAMSSSPGNGELQAGSVTNPSSDLTDGQVESVPLMQAPPLPPRLKKKEFSRM